MLYLVSDPDFIAMVFVEGGPLNNDTAISDFYLGKYETTQGLWKAVMGNNPSHFTGNDNLPVEMVSWDDIQIFIEKLNKKTGKKYRLPVEVEWQYAARGGNKSKKYGYSGSDSIDEVAWHKENSHS
jgi:formylglycine-generating enzyme required for sulfatase activity